jgi:hypothetical protein
MPAGESRRRMRGGGQVTILQRGKDWVVRHKLKGFAFLGKLLEHLVEFFCQIFRHPSKKIWLKKQFCSNIKKNLAKNLD